MNSLNEKFESSKIIRLIKTDFEQNSRDYSNKRHHDQNHEEHHLDFNTHLDLERNQDLENHHFEIDQKDHFSNHQ